MSKFVLSVWRKEYSSALWHPGFAKTQIQQKKAMHSMVPLVLPGFPTCHRATLFFGNEKALLFHFISTFCSEDNDDYDYYSTEARNDKLAVFLSFSPSIYLPFLFLLISRSFVVGCCSGPIRETRHDFDISPGGECRRSRSLISVNQKHRYMSDAQIYTLWRALQWRSCRHYIKVYCMVSLNCQTFLYTFFFIIK